MTHPSPALPNKRGSCGVTHRYHALSPLSTCGKTPPSFGTDSRHQASLVRRYCSTSLGSRTSVSSSAPEPPAARTCTASTLALMLPPGQAAQGVRQTSVSLPPQGSGTSMTDEDMLANAGGSHAQGITQTSTCTQDKILGERSRPPCHSSNSKEGGTAQHGVGCPRASRARSHLTCSTFATLGSSSSAAP